MMGCSGFNEMKKGNDMMQKSVMRLAQIGTILILSAVFLGGCSARPGASKLGTMCNSIMLETCQNAHTPVMRDMCVRQGCVGV